MDPGTYLAQTNPAITSPPPPPGTEPRTSPGSSSSANSIASRTRSSSSLNLDEVVRNPGDPGDPLRLRPAPDDLLGWLVSSAGMEIVGEVAPVEIDGFPGQQADIRVPLGRRMCAEEHPTVPRSVPPVLHDLPGTSGLRVREGVVYRITVLPDVAGETVTLLFTDYPERLGERAEVADGVVRSIEFDV